MSAILLVLAACSPAISPNTTVTPKPKPVTAKDFGVLQWRWVGPAVMGGRLDAVAGVAGDPRTIFLGHSSGGLYKSTDGGLTLAPIFTAGNTTSIGALAVAASNPKIVFAGTGEGFPRNTASSGDGIFVSRDGGKTWKFSGLRDSEHIAKIAIDPRNAQVVLAAALGHEWTPGGQRGIFRSQDSGVSWQRVIYVNATTGGSDIIFDPENPNIVYAGTFDFIRRPWTFRGGGIGSGLYKSTDNGRTWVKLTDPALHDGLPGGIINRVGVSLTYHHPESVYAIVPTRHGMLYHSSDAGAHWTLVNASADINFRPFYFSQVRADPDDVKRLYVLTGDLKLSTDGGKTFKDQDAGGDNHDLWIDPKDHDRILLGSDMGFDLSLDRGETWDYIDTEPFAQVYRVGYDFAVPYHIMGGMQDHEVWWGPNTLWNDDGVGDGDWRNISDWGDGQYAMADPRDADIVYEDTHFGDLVRRNLRTGEARYISPQPIVTFGTGVGSFRYRFNWSAPLLLSRYNSNVLYYGGNVLFKSLDQGQSWNPISPDLSRPCKKSWLRASGGPIGHDNTNAESYCTIYAISEDAHDPATLWAGTDDGHLSITRDGGTQWRDVIGNIPGLAAPSWVSSVHASDTTSGVAYVSFDRHRSGDPGAYVFATGDYGRTWRNISHGLPRYVNVVREDPRQPNLLFAGTEGGVFASFDRGRHWLDLRLGLAHVPVYDLAIQPVANDLILGTHGRGFYILDDITPLEQLAQAAGAGVLLFPPETAWRYVARPATEHGRGEFVSDNKPYGASIAYYLAPGKHRPKHVKLEILDAAGHLVRTLDATTVAGINRVVWDLQSDPPGGKNAVQDPRDYYVFYPLAISGPEVLPGTYTARLSVRGRVQTTSLAVKLDPALDVDHEDLQAQYDALARLAGLQERGEVSLNRIAGLDKQIDARLKRLTSALLRKQLVAYRDRIDALANQLRNGDGSENSGYKQPAQLIDNIAYQRHIIATYIGAPTQAQRRLIEVYSNRTAVLDASANALFTKGLRPLNAELRSNKLSPLIVRVTRPKAGRHRSPNPQAPAR